MVPEEPGDRDRKKWKTIGGGRAIVHDVPRSKTLALSSVYVHTYAGMYKRKCTAVAQVGSCFELSQKFPLRLGVNLNRFNLILLPYAGHGVTYLNVCVTYATRSLCIARKTRI